MCARPVSSRGAARDRRRVPPLLADDAMPDRGRSRGPAARPSSPLVHPGQCFGRAAGVRSRGSSTEGIRRALGGRCRPARAGGRAFSLSEWGGYPPSRYGANRHRLHLARAARRRAAETPWHASGVRWPARLVRAPDPDGLPPCPRPAGALGQEKVSLPGAQNAPIRMSARRRHGTRRNPATGLPSGSVVARMSRAPWSRRSKGPCWRGRSRSLARTGCTSRIPWAPSPLPAARGPRGPRRASRPDRHLGAVTISAVASTVRGSRTMRYPRGWKRGVARGRSPRGAPELA